MNYEDVWQLQDQITAAVNALGYSIWDLHFDHASFTFRLELNEKVEEENPFRHQQPSVQRLRP